MSNYYLGTSPDEALGLSSKFWYALRRNIDGELFFVSSDQLRDSSTYEINIPGPPSENFEDFEAGIDFVDGINADHELEYANMKYPQYRWDDRSIFYYVDDEGQLVQRIFKGYAYPEGISS